MTFDGLTIRSRWLDSLPLLSILGLAYWLLWIIYARWFHPLRNVPGPWLASVSRLWILYVTWRGDMDHVQRELHQKYGSLIRVAPNECICSDPDAIKKIYRAKNPLTKTDFYPPWGNGAISKHPDSFSVTDERLHAERRRIVNHVYSLSNVLQSEQYIDECSTLFIKRLGSLADSGTTLDLGEWLQWYAFDVIGQLYFGQMFGFMEGSHDYGNYIESLDTLMPVICLSGIAPTYVRPLLLISAIFSAGVRKALKAIDHIAAAAKNRVAERVEIASSGRPHPQHDLLHQLLEIVSKKGPQVDFGIPEVQKEAYVGFFAGSDTTAIAMRAVFYYLMKSPAVYRKILVEIDEATAQGKLSMPIKYAEAIELPYLCACIKEAMRLHPSVGLAMPRHAPSEGLDLNNHHIPTGYRVGINAAVVHRDPAKFGAEPEKFAPERWLGGNSKEMDRYMLHFGAGTRTCIGKNISLSELHKLIPLVLKEFKLELVNPGIEWVTNDMWFNKQTGIRVKISRRSSTAS